MAQIYCTWLVCPVGRDWAFYIFGTRAFNMTLPLQVDKRFTQLSKDEVEYTWSRRVWELIQLKNRSQRPRLWAVTQRRHRNCRALLSLSSMWLLPHPSFRILPTWHILIQMVPPNRRNDSPNADNKTQTEGSCSVSWSTQQKLWEAKGEKGGGWNGPWRTRGSCTSQREQSSPCK